MFSCCGTTYFLTSDTYDSPILQPVTASARLFHLLPSVNIYKTLAPPYRSHVELKEMHWVKCTLHMIYIFISGNILWKHKILLINGSVQYGKVHLIIIPHITDYLPDLVIRIGCKWQRNWNSTLLCKNLSETAFRLNLHKIKTKW